MKIFCYIVLITLTNAWILRAQTNAIAGPNLSTNANTNAVSQILALVTTNPPPANPQSQETVIQADGPAEFNEADHGLRVTYRDNVRVDAPGLKLWCEWLTADMSQASGHPTNIVAETNVVIDAMDDKGQKMHATCDKAVYVFAVEDGVTNETVTLMGHAKAEYENMTLTGNPMIWDRTHDRLSVPSNPKMVFHPGLNIGTSTNSTVVGTNLPVATNSVVVGTNVPIVETNLPSAANNQTSPPK